MELGIELPLIESNVLALWKQKNNPLHDIVNWDKNDRTFAWTTTVVNDNVGFGVYCDDYDYDGDDELGWPCPWSVAPSRYRALLPD